MFARRNSVHQELCSLLNVGKVSDLTDIELLERFATRDGEGAENSFTALVDRHGSMVFRVCRAVLRDPHEAQDAFQATFLVLVRKADSLRVRESLGPWLHGVAYRIATHARSRAARRSRMERTAAEFIPRPTVEGDGHDLEALIHEEIDRLPGRYRAAVILCDLDGLTHEDAARHLGCPVGTIKSRLARGRGRLRDRLVRRGLVPSIGVAGGSTFPGIVPSAPAGFLPEWTTRIAMEFASSGMKTGAHPAPVLALAEGAMKSMWLIKVKSAVGATILVGTVAIGAAALAQQRSRPGASGAAPTARVRDEFPALKGGSPRVATPIAFPAQGERRDENGIKALLIDGLLARSEAVRSGRLEYHLKVEIAGRTERDQDYRFSFSSNDWARRSPRLNEAVINRDGRLLNYTQFNDADGPVHGFLTIRSPESPFQNPPFPPVRAGTIWYASTRRFVKERANQSRLMGEESVNGVETQVLEWDVAAGDAYFAFEAIPESLSQGGKLRLYVAQQLGYAMPRIEHVDNFTTVQTSFDFSDFEEVCPGIFFPMRYRIGPGFYTEAGDLKKVEKVNGPIPEEDFILSIPAGTSVSDNRPKTTDEIDPDKNRTYKIRDYPFRNFRTNVPYPRGFPAELLKELDRDVAKAGANKTVDGH